MVKPVGLGWPCPVNCGMPPRNPEDLRTGSDATSFDRRSLQPRRPAQTNENQTRSSRAFKGTYAGCGEGGGLDGVGVRAHGPRGGEGGSDDGGGGGDGTVSHWGVGIAQAPLSQQLHHKLVSGKGRGEREACG